jgi:hypothetical protein
MTRFDGIISPHAAVQMAKAALAAADGGLGAEELANAPRLEQWHPALVGARLCLCGTVTGHPGLGTGPITTSMLMALSEDLTWARTVSRFYRLGRPLELDIAAAIPGAKMVDVYDWPAMNITTARSHLAVFVRWLLQHEDPPSSDTEEG